jgi:HD-like signal output (HDOD) protein/ActR/RegA family two-component response regulator
MADSIVILFVDDDTNLIQGLKRMLYSMRKEWEMYFCDNIEEALNVLKKKPVDVIVSDMRMPIMDGTALLKLVKEKYPPVIRIILSGYSGQEMSIKASGLAHRFLAKPANTDTIKSTINGISSLRALVHNPKLLRLVSGITKLPSLPQIYTDLETEIDSQSPSLKKIGDLISRDISMTAKLLQLVNSAFFGLPQNITDPIQALNFLGLEVVKSLVLLVKIFSSIDKNSHFNINSFVAHSMKVGKCAKEIMRLQNFPAKIQEETFIAGILHDVGKLVLLQIPNYFKNILDIVDTENIDFYNAEYKMYGTSHAEIGAYILGLWGLPSYLVNILNYHHLPSQSGAKNFSSLSAVHIANFVFSSSKLDSEHISKIGYKSKIDNIIKEVKFYGEEL